MTRIELLTLAAAILCASRTNYGELSQEVAEFAVEEAELILDAATGRTQSPEQGGSRE